MLNPIIYVRGYAMTESERTDTASDPFCGFDVGSTVFRATPDKTARGDKFVFESPVLRLVTDFGYRHVYENGADNGRVRKRVDFGAMERCLRPDTSRTHTGERNRCSRRMKALR